MDRKIEGLIVILLLVLVVFVVRAEITGNATTQTCEQTCNIQDDCLKGVCRERNSGDTQKYCICKQTEDSTGDSSEISSDLDEDPDPLRFLFDAGDKKLVLSETLAGFEVPKIDGGEVVYPQAIIWNYPEKTPNTKKGNWEFESWFDKITGMTCSSDGCLRMKGQMNCDKNGHCIIGWFDYYSGAGCELNVLGAELQFSKTEKKAEIVGECGWYYNKGAKEKAEIELLAKVPRSSIPELDAIYGQIVVGESSGPIKTEYKGNLNYCEEDYEIIVDKCWGTFDTDNVWPKTNEIKEGVLHLTYTSSIAPLAVSKLSGKKAPEIEKEVDEKISFKATRHDPVPAPKKDGPGLYVGIGAAAIAAGIAWGALSWHQKQMMAKSLAAKTVVS